AVGSDRDDREAAGDERVVLDGRRRGRRRDLDDRARLRALCLCPEVGMLERDVLAADDARLDEHVAERAGPPRAPRGGRAPDRHRTRRETEVERRAAAGVARREYARDVEALAAVQEER